MPLLEAEDIFFSYDNNSTNFYLSIPKLSIAKGDFVTIFGPNGSGKSTLLKILSGTLIPQTGSVLFENSPLNTMSSKEISQKIAYVSQQAYSIFPFSVYEIVMMGRTPFLNFFGFEKRNDHLIVQKVLETVGISELKNKCIHEISGGEAQRAFVARALAQNPKVLLLDEPNAHLDINHQIGIFNILKKINSQNDITIILISHDINLSAYFSKRTILMKNGVIYKDGPFKDILTVDNIKTAFDINAEIEYDGKTGIKRIFVDPSQN